MAIGCKRPLGPNPGSPRRSAGPLLALALGMALGASTLRGQWLETKITLPDSLGGATGPCCLATDSSERFVYVGDYGGAVYVVDAETGLRKAKVATDSTVGTICSNPRRNKVYAANFTKSKVTVISCATNQVVARVRVGSEPTALCYNGRNDKVYCASGISGNVAVIDGATDSVVATRHAGRGLSALCYNPTSNRIFCAAYDTLAVLDGASDSVVALIPVRVAGNPMTVNPVSNKVYVAGGLVLDGTTGSVLDSVPTVGMALCCNPSTNRLYYGEHDDGEVVVIDGAADSVVDCIEVGHYVISVACDTATNRIYVARTDLSRVYEVVVVDGITNSITARIRAGSGGELLGSPRRGRMYCADWCGGIDLSVIDAGPDSLLHIVKLGGGSRSMCYDPTDDKVYYVGSEYFVEVGAIDAATNRPVAHIPVGPVALDIVWHRPNNRVYCVNNIDHNVSVIDPRADTVVKTVTVGPHPVLLCSASRVNKIYCGRTHELTVIDCGSDTVVKTIPIPAAMLYCMCYVSTGSYDKLYCGGLSALSVVDCVGDTVTRSFSLKPFALARDSAGKRVYCADEDSLCVYDACADTLVATIPWGATAATELLYAPGVEKVYCARYFDDYVLVVDAGSGAVITQIPTPGPDALGYDHTTGLVYCGRPDWGKVMFIDSRTDSIVDSLSPCFCPNLFTMVPAHNRVYVGNNGHSFIPVIRTDLPGVEDMTHSAIPRGSSGPRLVARNRPLVVSQPSVLLDAVGRKLYEVNPGQHDLSRYRAGVYFLRSCTRGTVVKLLLVP